MKKALLGLLTALCLVLAACGGSGGSGAKEEPEEKVTGFDSVAREDDQIKTVISFDQDYEDVHVIFHSDINNDTFEGTAEHEETLGAVEAGKPYNVDVPTNDGWSLQGTFKGVNFGANGQPQLVMPDISEEKVTITVKDGETELATADVE